MRHPEPAGRGAGVSPARNESAGGLDVRPALAWCPRWLCRNPAEGRPNGGRRSTVLQLGGNLRPDLLLKLTGATVPLAGNPQRRHHESPDLQGHLALHWWGIAQIHQEIPQGTAADLRVQYGVNTFKDCLRFGYGSQDIRVWMVWGCGVGYGVRLRWGAAPRSFTGGPILGSFHASDPIGSQAVVVLAHLHGHFVFGPLIAKQLGEV
jgi:hypothetical protein